MSSEWLTDAAVRVHFHEGELAHSPPSDELKDYATRLEDGRWMLPEAVRREELGRAGLDKARAALALVTPTAEEDPRQTQFRTLLAGHAEPLQAWTSDELRSGLSVVKWLSGIPNIDLPDPEAILGQYERSELLRPLRDAVRSFRGRAKELDCLKRHALGQTPGTSILVSGVGGTGKTTLLCQHVLDLDKEGIAVAYLDLDRADLALTERRVQEGLESVARNDHRPGMLAAEVILQLATIAGDPSYRRFAKSRRRGWLKGEPFDNDLKGMLAALKLPRAVVVIDTLEEAQYAGASSVGAIREMISAISSVSPNVRFVIGGRAEEPLLDAEPLVLGNLDPAEAADLLSLLAKPVDLSTEVAKAIVSRITANPLWLVVAGQAVARKAVDVSDLEGLHGTAATAFLYLRILGHVHADVPHPELIEPSLLLRVVEPGLLTTVIAPELRKTLSLEEAELHITALRREVALARPEGQGLRHRPEVRVLTLQGLYQADPGRWARIHAGAAAWWGNQASPSGKLERQYHEQMLRSGPGTPQLEELEPTRTMRSVRLTRSAITPRTTSISDAQRAAESGDWTRVEQVLEHDTSAQGLRLRAQARYALHFPEQAIELMEAAWHAAQETDDAVTAHDSILELSDWWTEAGEAERAAQTLDGALANEGAPIRCLRLLDRRHRIAPRDADQAALTATLTRLGGLEPLDRDQPLLKRLLGWGDDERLLLQALLTPGLSGFSSEAMQRLASALADWEEGSGMSALTTDAVISSGDLLSLFSHLFHDAGQLSEFVRRYFPKVDGSLPPNLATDELAFECVQALERFALTGEQLRRALLDTAPDHMTTINAYWRRAGLRQNPGEMARSIAKVRDRQGTLDVHVAMALRAGFGATARPAEEPEFKELEEVLGAALPTTRQRLSVATTLRLPDPNVAARTPLSLIRAAEASGVLGDSEDALGLVSTVARFEPAFSTHLVTLERRRRVTSYVNALGDTESLDRRAREAAPVPIDKLERLAAEARPAIFIRNEALVAPGPIWAARLADARPRIFPAIRAVGTLEHPAVDLPLGCAVMVGADLALTSRRVADFFTRGTGKAAQLTKKVTLDLATGAASHVLDVREVVLVHPYWDIALLRVAGFSGEPLALSTSATLLPGRVVVEIGCPTPSPNDYVSIHPDMPRDDFGGMRLCPGRLLVRRSVKSFDMPVSALAYDSSTIGHRWGAAVVDLDTGELLGLHFAHRYLEANYAVPSFELARDDAIIAAGVRFASPPPGGPSRWDQYWQV